MHPFVSSTVGHAYNGQRDAQEDTHITFGYLECSLYKVHHRLFVTR